MHIWIKAFFAFLKSQVPNIIRSVKSNSPNISLVVILKLIHWIKAISFLGIQGLEFYLDKDGDVQYNFTLLDYRWNKSKPGGELTIYTKKRQKHWNGVLSLK